MKNSIQLAILGMAIALSSCIKDKEKSVVKPIEPDAQVQTQVDDNNKLKEEDDAVNNELRDAIEKIGSISGARMAADTVKVWCGCSVDSVNIAAKEVTFVFDNKTYCGNPSRIRSGKIKVKLVKGQKWRDANAVFGFLMDTKHLKMCMEQVWQGILIFMQVLILYLFGKGQEISMLLFYLPRPLFRLILNIQLPEKLFITGRVKLEH